MYFIELKNLDTVNNLVNLCTKYKEKMYVDISYGRYVIDGCSILAVTSLIGKIVKIVPTVNDDIVFNNFADDLIKIGAYKV